MSTEYIVECEEGQVEDLILVLPRSCGAHPTVHERIIRCHDCDYLLEDTNYCKLWHKHGFGRSHFCSYGSPRASS